MRCGASWSVDSLQLSENDNSPASKCETVSHFSRRRTSGIRHLPANKCPTVGHFRRDQLSENDSSPGSASGRARDIYDREAKERQKRKSPDAVQENLPEQKGQARDAVGKAVGVSGKSLAAIPVLTTSSPLRTMAGTSTESSGVVLGRLSALTFIGGFLRCYVAQGRRGLNECYAYQALIREAGEQGKRVVLEPLTSACSGLGGFSIWLCEHRTSRFQKGGGTSPAPFWQWYCFWMLAHQEGSTMTHVSVPCPLLSDSDNTDVARLIAEMDALGELIDRARAGESIQSVLDELIANGKPLEAYRALSTEGGAV